MMKFLATVATLVLMAFALQPALAQDKKETKGTGTETVAGRPIFPTGDLEALFKMRESWGTEPSVTSAEADVNSGKSKAEK